MNRLNAEKDDRARRSHEIRRFMTALDRAEPIDVWDETAWPLLVRQVTVYGDGHVEVLFRGENRVVVKIE